MSTTYIATIVNLLAVLLPYIGITIGTQEIETTIQTLVAVVTGIWVLYQRTTLQKAPAGFGDVSPLGIKK